MYNAQIIGKPLFFSYLTTPRYQFAISHQLPSLAIMQIATIPVETGLVTETLLILFFVCNASEVYPETSIIGYVTFQSQLIIAARGM